MKINKAAASGEMSKKTHKKECGIKLNYKIK